MNNVTRLLEAVQAGDRKAAAELLPLVYEELRKLAAVRIADEKPGHTLNATALVHEAYLRLVGDQQFEGRGHFFAAAAEAMRRILIENARRKQGPRRGGERRRIHADLDQIAMNSHDIDLLALDEALNILSAESPIRADLVKLRFFVGMTTPEAATALGISVSTAERYWAYARTRLFSLLADTDEKSDEKIEGIPLQFSHGGWETRPGDESWAM